MTITDRLAFVLATWFGCGLVPRAPGTAGTLGALPLYWLVAREGALTIVAAALAVTVIGVWASSRVAARLAAHDPQIVCIDEAAGVLVTLAAAPATVAGIIVAVVLFRIFDIVKPWPARWAERRLPRGWGIVGDDIVAGLWGAGLILCARAAGGY